MRELKRLARTVALGALGLWMLHCTRCAMAAPCLQPSGLQYPCYCKCPCIPNAQNFGYFCTRWRQWPGELRPEVLFPQSLGVERIPTPAGEQTRTLPKAVTPPGAPRSLDVEGPLPPEPPIEDEIMPPAIPPATEPLLPGGIPEITEPGTLPAIEPPSSDLPTEPASPLHLDPTDKEPLPSATKAGRSVPAPIATPVARRAAAQREAKSSPPDALPLPRLQREEPDHNVRPSGRLEQEKPARDVLPSPRLQGQGTGGKDAEVSAKSAASPERAPREVAKNTVGQRQHSKTNLPPPAAAPIVRKATAQKEAEQAEPSESALVEVPESRVVLAEDSGADVPPPAAVPCAEEAAEQADTHRPAPPEPAPEEVAESRVEPPHSNHSELPTTAPKEVADQTAAVPPDNQAEPTTTTQAAPRLLAEQTARDATGLLPVPSAADLSPVLTGQDACIAQEEPDAAGVSQPEPPALPPQAVEPEVATPQVALPQVAPPQVATREVVTPQVAPREVVTPEVATREFVKPEVAPVQPLTLQANWTAALHPGFRGDAPRALVTHPWSDSAERAVYQTPAESPPRPATQRQERAQPSRQSTTSDRRQDDLSARPAADTRRDNAPPVALDGFCPVELCDHERWVAGNPQITVVHHGRTYTFSSTAQRQRFLANPERYAPMFSGEDPVLIVDGRGHTPGRTDYCVIYEGRLYMFASEATLLRFQKDPQRFTKHLPSQSPR